MHGELVDTMASRADHLTTLNRAVFAQEQRLEELRDIDAASASLDALIDAYDERRQAAEDEYAVRVAELAELKADLDAALRQAHQLAAKALERRTTSTPAAADLDRE